MTPNWFLNIASPVVGVPLHLFSISVFIGKLTYQLLPYVALYKQPCYLSPGK